MSEAATMKERARLALEEIIEDLTDRRGLRQQWEQADDEVREQIQSSWGEIIEGYIADAVAEEREACAKIADGHWPETGHQCTGEVSCPMSISILIRRRR